MKLRSLVVFFSAIFISACAYTKAIPIGPNDTTTEGIRIPQMKPLLVVANSQASVLMVPNSDRGYALKFGEFLAKNDCELDLDNMQLTKVHCVEDSTAIPIEFFKVLENAATAKLPLGQLFAAQVSGTSNARFQIFAIKFDDLGNISSLNPLLNGSTSFVEMPTSISGGTVPPAPAGAAGGAAGGAAKPAPAGAAGGAVKPADPNNPIVN
jgi:hypothetical protein